MTTCILHVQSCIASFPGSTPQLFSHGVEKRARRAGEWSLGTRLIAEQEARQLIMLHGDPAYVHVCIYVSNAT